MLNIIRKNIPVISTTLVSLESEDKVNREFFLNCKNSFDIYNYLKLRQESYDKFMINLNNNQFEKSKTIFNKNIIYGLQHKQNICHCEQWQIFDDIIKIALDNDYDKFVWFYENIIVNYKDHIKKESNDINNLEFFDSAWRSNNKIDFDILKRLSNTLFRTLVSQYSQSKNKNENSYKILKYLIESNNVDINQISYAQNTVCTIGDLDMFKFLDSNVKINYNIEYGDFFRNACSHGHLEIAKILFDKKCHTINKFGFDNTFYITCRDCKNIEVIKWICSIYDGKHIMEIKNLFNSLYYNKETKQYLESIRYIF